MLTRAFETPAFRDGFAELLRWRRDVRRFRPDPVPPALVTRLLEMATLAPSVGLSQPWRFLLVESPDRRAAIRREFEASNAEAARIYAGEQASRYAALKLEGLREAPIHLAVCAARDPVAGHGLGRQTQPATLRDSVVCAIHTLWLAARVEGLGLGWISILRPAVAEAILDVPSGAELVAYLVLGWPEAAGEEPELAVAGWEQRQGLAAVLETR
ncbi:5,6-dimethylbenzimidazole synthase [Roseococcus thiosulfatophilus]|uniref:5,6-dimethylbenzimidazole synthase n=1 Tax=Roseococcus thiosulfatophilus TaxID=35813 RepID=UPI001A8EFF8A|nr:5,6-dimethylbenzimidazole synthase [Roseococcus thiosulfatophilus]